MMRRTSVSMYSGPLPAPEDLIRYNEAFPGCAERIVVMAEHQSDHRRGLESRVVDQNIKHDHRGQTLGFVIALVGIVGSMVLMDRGQTASGLAVFFTMLSSLVGLFVTGKIAQRRELDQKNQPPAPSPPAKR